MNEQPTSFEPGLAEIETILERLVSFDTTSHKSNLDLIAYIQDYLTGYGVAYQLIPNDEGDKASLLASVGPDVPGGIGLSGHTDVVPVTGQDWSTDPFTLTRQGTKLYGRGSTDMKGFLAVMLAAVPLFQKAKLQKPVHLIFSYDEETGCTGVRPMIERMGKDLPMPEFVMVGEPSNCQVVEAHKGIVSFVTTVRGFEAHSSLLHLGVSAVAIAARLINFLSETQATFIKQQNDGRFTPPYSTVHVGMVEGGTARNIVAKHCSFAWEVRSLPGFHGIDVANQMMAFASECLLPDMKAISKSCDISTLQKGEVPGLAAHASAIELGLKLARQNASHAVSYGTEAGLFELADMPCVICGPGNINEAHKPDEFIEEAELIGCMAAMRRIIEQLS